MESNKSKIKTKNKINLKTKKSQIKTKRSKIKINLTFYQVINSHHRNGRRW